MPSVKITELPVLTQLSANNANTVFVAVDKTTNTTSQFSTTTLAGGLFANNVLNVGTQTPSTFPGLIAQFIANTAPYGQVNFENANSAGSMDVVLTADIGDDANNFLDLGINNSVFIDPIYSATKAADGYLLVFGQQGNDYVGNLVLGTAAAETNVVFSVGGTTNLDVVAKMTKNGLEFDNSGYITFDDNSTQTVAASPAAVTLAAQANTIITQGVDATQNTRLNSIETVNADQNTAISIIQGVNLTQNTNITTANNHAWAAFDKANTALQNTATVIVNNNLIVPGSITANSIILNDAGLYQYSTANNSTVTQLTSKSTAVTCNGRTGQITTNNASLAKGDSVQFTVNNNQIVSAKDVVMVCISSGASSASYQISVDAVAIGSFGINITNNGTGPLSEALVINFAIIRVN